MGNNKMRIYSPHQTELWLTCPIKRALSVSQGYEPRNVGKRDLASILGKSFMKGIEFYYKDTEKEKDEEYGKIAKLHALTDLADLDGNGKIINQWDQAQANSLPRRAAKLVTRFLRENPIPSNWPILGVEQEFPDYGNCRLDLVVQDDRSIVPVDFKVKLNLKKEYEEREIARYRHSWAMFHYVWTLSQAHNTNVDHYYICMVILEPSFRVKFLEFPIHPEEMEVWIGSAERVWFQMEKEDKGDALPWMTSKHSDEYGPCEFYQACFTHRYDENLMKRDYVQKSKY